MAESPLVAYVGTLNRFRVTLRDRDAAPLACDPSDPLAVAVWAGDDQAQAGDIPVTVAWERDDDGNSLASFGQVLVAVDLAGSAPDEGVYRLRIEATIAGRPEDGFEGHLEIVGAPGSGGPPKVYASHDEMRGISDQVDALFNTASGRAGFLEERGDARAEIDRRFADRPPVRPGFVARHVAAFDPVYGYDRPDATLSPPDRDTLKDLLAADALARDDRLRKMASTLAVAMVLERQLTGGRNPYQDEAVVLRDRFDEAMRCYRPRLNVTVEGHAVQVEIGHGTATYFGLPEPS